MSRLLTLLAGTCMATSWAGMAIAMEVTWGSNGPEVKIDSAEVAVFSPRKGEVWVVAPGRQAVTVAQEFSGRERWRAEELRVSGGKGVRLMGPSTEAWRLNGSPNAWRVAMGHGTAFGGYASVTVFKDGRIVGDGTLLQAQASSGERYRMLATRGTVLADASNGWTQAIGGVVRAETAKLAARMLPVEKLAAIQPASGEYKVPFTAAESLPALATPVGDNGAVVEGVMPDLREVYHPGEVREFVWPKGVRWENGKLVGLDAGGDAKVRNRKVELARAVGAMGEATRKAEEVLAKKIPTKVVKPVEIPRAVATLADHAVSKPDAMEAKGWHLPVVGPRKDYLPNLIVLQNRIAMAKTEQAKDDGRRELAKFYLAWQRPHEAMALVTMLPYAKNGKPREVEDRLVIAIAHAALGQSDEALAMLERIGPDVANHAAVWRTVALQQQGRSAEALKSWPDRAKLVEGYPGYLRKMVQNSVAEALLAVGDAKQSLGYVSKLVKGYEADTVPSDILRLQGLALLRANKGKEGLESLAKAAEEGPDMATSYRSKYEFVTALRQRREIDDKQLINYLEELRLFWRGDDVEPRVLHDLGDLYAKRRDYRQALSRWRTLVRVYPDIPDMAYVTDRMTQSVLAAFDPENPEVYDPITYAGLYFDFRELLPSDERGDRVAERVGRLLTETTLAERAVPILEQTLRFGVKEQTDRARLSVLLAKAYMGQGKPEDALKLLDSLGGNIPNTVLKQQAMTETAKALVELERYADAMDVLDKADNDPLVRQLKAETAWRAGYWPKLRDFLSSELSGVSVAEMKDSQVRQIDLLRLGYALAELNQGNEIVKLQAKYQDVLDSVPVVADTLAAMASMVGASPAAGDIRPLSQVAGALARLNTFGDDFRARQALVKRSREEQKEYNNRMKYMDILPPPKL